MQKRIKLFLLIGLISLSLTGCWDATELNTLNLTTAVILDKKEGAFTFILEIPKINPTTSGGSGSGGNDSRSKYAYLKGSGASIPEARDDGVRQMDKPPHLSTVNALILTENAADNDLAEYLFRLREDFDYRQKVKLVITSENPDDLIKAESEEDEPIGFIIDDMLTSIMETGRTYCSISSDYTEQILNNRGFVVPCIGLKDKQIYLKSYSVFNNSKRIGSIPYEESKGLVFWLANNPKWVYRVPYQSGNATVEISVSKKIIRPSVEGGVPLFDIRFDFKGSVLYTDHIELFPLSKEVKGKIKNNLEKLLYEEIENTVMRSQNEFRTDYLGFDEIFRIAYPRSFENIQWNSIYPVSKMSLSVNVDIEASKKMDYEPNK